MSSLMIGDKLAFPGQYVSAAELMGKDVTLAIESIKEKTLQMASGETEDKIVMTFKGAKKPLVLNRTNGKSIGKLHGPQLLKWVGKKVTLYPTTCMAFGQRVDCIRVRETEPEPSE